MTAAEMFNLARAFVAGAILCANGVFGTIAAALIISIWRSLTWGGEFQPGIDDPALSGNVSEKGKTK